MPIPKSVTQLLWLTLLLVFGVGVNAAVYIDTVNGLQSAFVIKRNGQELTEIAPYKPLQVGDEIQVIEPDDDGDGFFDDPENTITLALGDGQFLTLTYEDTKDKPYRVEKRAPPSVLVNIMETISKGFHQLWNQDIQNKLKELGLEGTPSDSTASLTMFLLQWENLKLIAGERELHLAWHGGKPPYRVRVSPLGSEQALWEEDNLTKAAVTLPKHTIALGPYQIVVADAKGKSVTGEFTAVADTSLLSHPEAQAIVQSDLPKRSKQTLLAAWLTRQDNGIWGFEAYQIVAGIKDYYPAWLVKQGLESRKRPE